MTTAGELSVAITGDTSRLMSSVSTQSAAAGTAGAKSFSSRFGGGILGSMKGVIGTLGITMGAVAAVNLFKGTISQASDLNESINAVNVTFGKSAAGIQQLGSEAATAVGLSANEFNSLAVRFSSFAKTVSGPGGDVVSTMDDMTTRAADFASVMNVDVNEAAQIFQSGLAGETEPLKKYGIDLSAAAVEAYAMKEGISSAGAEMTEQQKVQARYALLMQETSKTQGDFANTSGGLANAQRILSAEFKNLQASVGSVLLPVLASAVSFLAQKVIPAIKGLWTFLSTGDITGALLDVFGIAEDSPIVAFFVNARNAIIDVFSQIGAVVSGFFASFSSIGSGGSSPLMSYFSAIVTFITGSVVPALQAFAQFIITSVVPVLVSIGQFIMTQVLPQLLNLYAFIGSSIIPIFTSFVDTLRTTILPVLTQLWGIFQTQILPVLKQVVVAFLAVAIPIIKVAFTILRVLIPPILKVAGFLIRVLIPPIAKVIGWIFRLIGVIITVGTWLVKAVVWFVALVVRGFMPVWVAAQKLWNIISTAFGAIVSAISGAIDKAIEWLSGMKDRILGVFSGAINWLGDIGGDIVQGLVDGIAAAWHWITDKLKELVDLLPSWITGPLQMDSPSKVMHAIGENISLGLAQGITAGAGGVQAAMAGVAPNGARIAGARHVRYNPSSATFDNASSQVQVFIGDRELTDIVRVETRKETARSGAAYRYRRN